MDDPTYLDLDAESLLTIAGGWSDVEVVIGDVKHTLRVVATGNLARRIRDVRVSEAKPRSKWKAIYFDSHKQWDITNDAGDRREEYSVIEDLTEENAALIVRAVNRDHLFDELVDRVRNEVSSTICICDALRRIATDDSNDTVCDKCKNETLLAKVEAAKEQP